MSSRERKEAQRANRGAEHFSDKSKKHAPAPAPAEAPAKKKKPSAAAKVSSFLAKNQGE
jgi:hypothetical protein